MATILKYVSDFSLELSNPDSFHHRTIPYLNTLPDFTPSYYLTELYPILTPYQRIFSHSMQSQQYPQVVYIIAGVIVSPRRDNSTRWCPGWKFRKFFSKNSHSAENGGIIQLPTLKHCQTHSICAKNWRTSGNHSSWSTVNCHASSANQNRSRKTLELRQPIRNKYCAAQVVSQSESRTKHSHISSANQNRVLRNARTLV